MIGTQQAIATTATQVAAISAFPSAIITQHDE